MRVLITGGAGFLGSHLSDRFLAEGHTVIAMDNLITGSTDNIAHLAGHERFSFIKHDVTNYIFIDGPLDAIIHFASPASPVDYLELPIQTLKVGALGTHKALGLAKDKGARFLLASTSETYGDPQVHPQPETYYGHVNPIGPRGVYDEAKRFAEAMTMAYHRYHGVETRIVRIFNTYGERMRLRDGRVVPNFIQQALRGEPLTVYGDGSQTRSFQYVSDLVEGVYRLLFSDEVEPVNIGNPGEFTIRQFAEIINEITGNKAGIVEKNSRTQDDPQVRQPDITKARRVLGWEPRVDVEEGLRRTIPWFRHELVRLGELKA
ncbi:MAG TPA: UDP-glucuronic acid decarboxylase family protein [Roseiflexaceae bacterium]|jgi:dTDP-glucose 4,6-dehydratase|nr:UDP-glucuronic acid decarboxylase family protein [Roseiflexaceae bacterium]